MGLKNINRINLISGNKMKTFKEIFNESSGFIPFKKKIEEAFKQSKYTLNSIPAIGSSIDLVFDFDNKKEAENIDVKYVEKILNDIEGLDVKHYSSKDYGMKQIQSKDWRKDSDSDPHQVYISFK